MNKYIEKLPESHSVCVGCSSCEIICGLTHEKAVSTSFNRIFVVTSASRRMHYSVYTCQQCDDAPCYEACPLKDKAMYRDEKGIVCINEESCIGCGKCQKACKYSPSRINLMPTKDKTLRKAKKCDLCKGRPEGPACVEHCPALCLAIAGEE